MSKDPAVLIYFDKWIGATNGMKAEYRAWYMDLMIYQYDKGGIPDDHDEIAGICRVRPSEYPTFKQMLEQVLEQKFNKGDDGLLRNPIMGDILRQRELFKKKRAHSGTIGFIIKMSNSFEWFKEFKHLKNHLIGLEISELDKLKDKQVLEQVLKQITELYIDEDVVVDITSKSSSKKQKGGTGEKSRTTAQIAFDLIPDTFHGDEFAVLWDDYEKLRKKKNKPLTETAVKQRVGQLVTISGGEWGIAKASMEETISSGWDRFFEVKPNGSSHQSSQVNGKRVRDKF